MKERRRSPRHPASWPVQLSLSDTCFLLGRTVDVSARGIRIRVLNDKLLDLVKLGKRYRIQVRVGETEGDVTRVGVVRHITNNEIGVEIDEELPLKVMRAIASETRKPSGSDSGVEEHKTAHHSIGTRAQRPLLLTPIPQFG